MSDPSSSRGPLRCGVIGAGVFGGYHADQYARLDGARLVGVYDLDRARAEAVAGPLGAEAFTDLDGFLAAVEAVSVTSPAVTHAEMAMAALRAGKHVYTEKPLAVALDDADALVAEARAHKRVLAVGHQERMVFRAMGLFDLPDKPLRLEAVRHGTFSPRNRDVSVVVDLMIHDIDLALALSGSEPASVEAQGSIDEGPGLDAVKAEAIFDGGLVAFFDASRVAKARDRRMKLVYPDGEVEIDFLARTFRNTTPHPLNEAFAETPVGKDPLGAAIRGFIEAVRGQGESLAADAEAGALALDLALAVEMACEAG